jgi:hypothetical protein
MQSHEKLDAVSVQSSSGLRAQDRGVSADADADEDEDEDEDGYEDEDGARRN